jgi:ATP-binding cassette subfamily B protein
MTATNGSNGSRSADRDREVDALVADGLAAAVDEDDDDIIRSQSADQRQTGRWNAGAIPMERSAKFGESVRRLFEVLGRERSRLALVAICAVGSVILNVLATHPRSGDGHDHPGPGRPEGVDFASLHRTLLDAIGVYLGATVLQLCSSWMITGLVQRTMLHLREQAERKVHALPLAYIDRHQRGDLLSRVTNDLDNLAQSLQQTLSQMLTSVLLLIGVAVMMFTISWLLALVALVTVPASIFGMKRVAGRARPMYLAQWSSTGALNGQIEEAFTGHAS